MGAAVMDRCVPAAMPPIKSYERERYNDRGTVDAEDAPFLVTPIGDGVATRNDLPFRTAADVASAVPETVDWIVPGFVAPGVVTELDGKLKASGKTTFVGALTRAALTGEQFLGYSIKLSKALWLTEERAATFAETLKRARLDDRTDLEVLHWHEANNRSWPVVMAGAIDRAKQIGASIIIVDTIGQWGGLKGDAENSNGAQLEAAAPLQEAAAHGLAVIVTRHERKGGGDVGDSGRGGSAFSGAVDIVVAIRRGEGKTKPTVRVLHCLSRFTETPDTLVIELTDDGYVALGNEGSVATLEAEGALLDRMPQTSDDALDVEALRLIQPVIARTAAKNAIKNLFAAGKVQRRGIGKRGDPHRYFLSRWNPVATQIPRGDEQPETGSVL